MNTKTPIGPDIRLVHPKPSDVIIDLSANGGTITRIARDGNFSICAGGNNSTGFDVLAISPGTRSSDPIRHLIASFSRLPSQLDLAFAIGAATQWCRMQK